MEIKFKKNKLRFTLFEVMIATVVVAISFTVILSAISLNLKNSAIAEGYITACLLTKTKIVEILNNDEFTVGEEKGDFGDNYPEFEWSKKIEVIENVQDSFDNVVDVIEDEANDSGNSNELKNRKSLFQITLQIKFKKANQVRSLEFETLVYGNGTTTDN